MIVAWTRVIEMKVVMNNRIEDVENRANRIC